MKGQISRNSRINLKWSDIAWTLLPALFWLAAVYSRALVITPRCAQHPETCTVASLPAMDRPAIGLETGNADGLSFTTQGLSGVLALAVPPLWHLGTVVLRTATPMGALIATGVDLVIFAQTAFINGALTETSHLLAQRPRPFVYANPSRGEDASNYTSFYSGHTSFSAASTTYLTLTLAGRGAPMWLVGASAAGAYALMSLTGTYRVLAGRHFPSDILIGALVGILVAVIVAMRHRRA
jgi:membrane-associated phospholipid phosphatase